ncbi:MAG: hypothetical protein CSA62_07105 [Planctomycetota bacterium]|nr:MAG: hypothetical protein CSA62_07105 [Planctomycetota bacterium]
MRSILIVALLAVFSLLAWFLFSEPYPESGLEGADPIESLQPLDQPGEKVEAEGFRAGDRPIERVQSSAAANAQEPSPEAVVLGEGDSAFSLRLLLDKRPLVGLEAGLSGRTTKGFSVKRSLAPSDSQGRLRCEGLAAGQYRIQLSGRVVGVGVSAPSFELAADEDKDLGTLEFPSPAKLKGSIVDGTGLAVAKAIVRISPSSGFADFLSSVSSDFGQREAASTVTDAQGRFAFPAVFAGKWVLRIDHLSFQRKELGLALAEGEDKRLPAIALQAGGSVEGVVVDAQGRPIAGVEITPRLQIRSAGSVSTGYAWQRRVMTDAKGHFRLGGLGKQLFVRVSKKGYRPLLDHQIELGQGHVRIELVQGRVLAGIVQATEKVDLAAARVHLLPNPQGKGRSLFRFTGSRSQSCDAKGRFHFEALDPGSYRLRAELPGYGISEVSEWVLTESGRSDLRLRLLKGPGLKLTVQDARAAPIAGAEIRLQFQAEADAPVLSALSPMVLQRFPGAIRRQARTDAAGQVEMKGLWMGSALLTVSSADHLSYQKQLSLTASDSELRIQLEQGGRIEGYAYAADGSLLKGARVCFRREDPGAEPRPHALWIASQRGGVGPGFAEDARSDAQGHFVSEPLAAGSYRVGLVKKSSGPQEFGLDLRLPSAGLSRFDENGAVSATVTQGQVTKVTLRQALLGGIRGSVLSRGQPVPNARVFLHPKGGDPFNSVQTKTDAGGRFEFADLQPGSYLVSAKPEAGRIASLRQEISVPKGGGYSQASILLGGGRVYGFVSPPGARSPRGLEVSLQRVGVRVESRKVMIAVSDKEGRSPKMSTMTQRPPSGPEPIELMDDGRFDFRFVPEGDWVLLVEQADGSRLARKDLEIAKDTDLNLGRVALKPSFAIKLRVLDAEGQPISFGSIRIYRWVEAGQAMGSAVFRGVVRNGEAKVAAIEAGRYRVEFQSVSLGRATQPEPQVGELRVDAQGGVTGGVLQLKR